mgnify:FL=1
MVNGLKIYDYRGFIGSKYNKHDLKKKKSLLNLNSSKKTLQLGLTLMWDSGGSGIF